MLERLIEYVNQAPPEAISQVTIQDISVCAGWYRSHAGNPLKLADAARIPHAVELWLKTVHVEPVQSPGQRRQWLLREIIDELEQGRTDQLKWDQVEVLCEVYELGGRAVARDKFNRVRGLIEPHFPALQALRTSGPVSPGLPAVSARYHVVTASDISAARPREIKLFAGIRLQARGPLMVHEHGHVKVLDNVPENVTLVLEDGSVSVDGFVMGRIAASHHCEVRDTVSGTVVVRQGNVCARGLVVKSYVVSKWGSVFCRQAEGPEFVYAGKEIRVDGSVTMGKFIAPRIHIEGDAFGGVFHASQRISARRFRRSDTRNLSIVLRTEISCQDYGEDPGPDGHRMLAKAARIRRQLAILQSNIEAAEAEAEHAARSGIVFVLGGEKAYPVAERLQRAEHRLSLIHRVIAATQTLIGIAEERLDRIIRYEGRMLGDEDDADRESTANAEREQEDIARVEAEGPSERDISDALQDIATYRERLFAPTADRKRVASILTQLRERFRAWQREADEINAAIARYQDEVQAIQDAILKTQNDGGPLLAVRFLRQVVAAIRDRGQASGSPQMLRLQSGFMRVALRTINNRVERREKELESAALQRQALREIARTLRKEYQIIIAEDASLKAPPRVSGSFDSGVKIFADLYLLDDPAPPHGAVVETVGGDVERTYLRENGLIVQA